MTLSVFLSMLSYMAIVTYTPGPANLLSLNISSKYGMRTFLKVLGGLFCGFAADMTICIALSLGFGAILPQFTTIMKYVGAAYILWLAVHIFRSKPSDEEADNEKKPGFSMGFFLQLSNVKIILYGFTVYHAYVVPYFHTPLVYPVFIVALPALGMSSCILWAFFGRLLSRFMRRYYRVCNTVMALSLLWCIYEILFK